MSLTILKFKFERNLSFHETAKILGTTNVKLLELLRKENILFKQGNRNLPMDKYMSKGWFEVYKSDIENSGFIGSVPIVRITSKGFEQIRDLLIKNPNSLKYYNSNTFKKAVRFMMSSRLKELGLEKFDNEEWIIRNSATETDYASETTSVFILHNDKREYLVKFNNKMKRLE